MFAKEILKFNATIGVARTTYDMGSEQFSVVLYKCYIYKMIMYYYVYGPRQFSRFSSSVLQFYIELDRRL